MELIISDIFLYHFFAYLPLLWLQTVLLDDQLIHTQRLLKVMSLSDLKKNFFVCWCPSHSASGHHAHTPLPSCDKQAESGARLWKPNVTYTFCVCVLLFEYFLRIHWFQSGRIKRGPPGEYLSWPTTNEKKKEFLIFSYFWCFLTLVFCPHELIWLKSN